MPRIAGRLRQRAALCDVAQQSVARRCRRQMLGRVSTYKLAAWLPLSLLNPADIAPIHTHPLCQLGLREPYGDPQPPRIRKFVVCRSVDRSVHIEVRCGVKPEAFGNGAA